MTLDPNTPATISGTGAAGLDVEVQNQGSADESDVTVDFEITGGTQTISGSGTIPRLAAGSIQTASIPIDQSPEKNTPLTLTVTVEPVPGEQITNNNRSTYSVTYRVAVAQRAIIPPVLHRVAFLGPAGTFSDDALRVAAQNAFIEPRPAATVYEAIRAVALGEVDRALVPFENSIEGSVRSTLDTLAFEDFQVTIAGEHDHPIRNSLIARDSIELERIEVVLSHPQASAQCARFIREELPRARVQAAPSTAEAVREVSSSSEPWAALGAASAARIYGCVVCGRASRTPPTTSPASSGSPPPGPRSPAPGPGEPPWSSRSWARTIQVPWSKRWEFSSRDVNLTRIESRPRRRGLGQYMFFLDLDGSAEGRGRCGGD